jgi:murein DD-endopeptidase MepM/ murein hydrolase activator NlpD
MVKKLREQAWNFLCAAFLERQVYIRSAERVQFITFRPLMQAILAGVSLLFLGWVAFTSVNVVFKEHIIANKERRYRQMESSYESRIADLQLSYNRLNSALLSAEDQFTSVADDFEAKQNALLALAQRKQALQAVAASQATQKEAIPQTASPAISDQLLAADGNTGSQRAIGGAIDAADADTPPPSAASLAQAPTATPNPAAPAQKIRLQQSSMLNFPGADEVKVNSANILRGAFGAVEKLTGTVFGKSRTGAQPDHPALAGIEAQKTRIAALMDRQSTAATALEKSIKAEIADLTKAIRMTGIEPLSLVAKAGKSKETVAAKDDIKGGVGGPLVPLSAADVNSDDEAFYAQTAAASESLDELGTLVSALRSVPLTPPVDYEMTSGFGRRQDPFTNTVAFHTGVDFGGPSGSDVRVTASGVVVYAGSRSSYGNVVEVDHGNGLRTRYAHLRQVLVKVGDKVEKGAPVGKLGSTGRSTGPHVHYEVWYNDKVRDPSKFLKAGRYVLQG